MEYAHMYLECIFLCNFPHLCLVRKPRNDDIPVALNTLIVQISVSKPHFSLKRIRSLSSKGIFQDRGEKTYI